MRTRRRGPGNGRHDGRRDLRADGGPHRRQHPYPDELARRPVRGPLGRRHHRLELPGGRHSAAAQAQGGPARGRQQLRDRRGQPDRDPGAQSAQHLLRRTNPGPGRGPARLLHRHRPQRPTRGATRVPAQLAAASDGRVHDRIPHHDHRHPARPLGHARARLPTTTASATRPRTSDSRRAATCDPPARHDDHQGPEGQDQEEAGDVRVQLHRARLDVRVLARRRRRSRLQLTRHASRSRRASTASRSAPGTRPATSTAHRRATTGRSRRRSATRRPRGRRIAASAKRLRYPAGSRSSHDPKR